MNAESDWTDNDGALERTIVLESFPAAIALVNHIAELAEREDHHPELRIDYRRVTVRWTTHSAGGITDRDRALAAATDQILAG